MNRIPAPLLLPGLTLRLTTLPGCTGIRLWLLNDEAADRPLPPELAQRIAEEAPFWAICWAAGLVLAEHFIANPALVRGKTVIDFGAGSGVVAIAARLAGAARAWVVDNDLRALEAARANAAENGVTLEYYDALDKAPPTADWVTAADLFYDPANLNLLTSLRTRGTLLVGEARCQTLDQHGLRKVAVVRAATVPAFNDPQFETVTLWEGD